MRSRSFRAMGTGWWIGCDRAELLPDAERRIHGLEARLSRFRPASALVLLNQERESDDPVLAEVVAQALAARDRTEGAFDPTLGRALSALGYDRDWASVGLASPAAPEPTRLEVWVEGAIVRLVGDGDLDLGGIAKGWAVDRVHDELRARGASRVLVDGGGDLRGSGAPFLIGAGDGHALILADGGVATSSTERRRWRTTTGVWRHHVLDPTTGSPARSELVEATVRAADAMTADVLATAVLVRPALLERLPAGASALVKHRLGARFTTASWQEAV